MNYSLGEHYRLESLSSDKLNLKLMRWGEVEERDAPKNRGGKVTGYRMDWVFTGKYAPNVEDGVRLAFEDAQVNYPGDTKTLTETIEAVKAIADELKLQQSTEA